MFERQIESRLLNCLDKIEHGSLVLTTPDGKVRHFEGRQPGPAADFTITDWRTVPAAAARGDIGLTEAYRDGWCDTRDLPAFLNFGLKNEEALEPFLYGRAWQSLLVRALYVFNRNTKRGSRRNISAHYDLGNDFYKLWLDETMTYSSAIFAPGDAQAADPLVPAQQRKYDRILDGLEASSGNLLEIGCGWGGFAERALQRGDFAPKGLTLSHEQAQFARDRLGREAEIVLQDYRDEYGKFDHVVSIEMFEAVGERYWPTYFEKIKHVLADRGRAMVQTITVADRYFDRYRAGGDMIRSFIFPGGMLPSPPAFREVAAEAGLRVEDAHAFGQDYARTLRDWLSRFDAKLPEVKSLGFDDGFIRVWRFYLAACIAAFEVGRTDVSQFRLAHA
ncbi:MAG: class I SAM-dependent methyltransferase [Rhodobacteraceae bacterium]|jgi:cyclopropane-fatty-acyl-phospholipid synthase|uniref:Cyclopropane-fatty-acyl-phospholipid synthase n=1 Tax=Salipiger profundus TaxID=1229727 RepID=A0A1U7D2I1_9RHOB|nr:MULTISPECIES: cyclopropane-fatty-acyl-phospholipid synthase family protein [Salipiger]APX22351.1 cyclopropane-fatty-acyl-phospholipid synthase [Salipiger profundus]MAB05636.1 class I SAM-dependent methyltransferase [Paracoccaceae bacterium]GGA22598.1 cyclopropane-fatty-acyl-phospholipid synthase [Salipiger profundus]SFD66241.1 cyclopropane-fatty-acyl-phospholipid synthase [Salipiger profundus]